MFQFGANIFISCRHFPHGYFGGVAEEVLLEKIAHTVKEIHFESFAVFSEGAVNAAVDVYTRVGAIVDKQRAALAAEEQAGVRRKDAVEQHIALAMRQVAAVQVHMPGREVQVTLYQAVICGIGVSHSQVVPVAGCITRNKQCMTRKCHILQLDTKLPGPLARAYEPAPQ